MDCRQNREDTFYAVVSTRNVFNSKLASTRVQKMDALSTQITAFRTSYQLPSGTTVKREKRERQMFANVHKLSLSFTGHSVTLLVHFAFPHLHKSTSYHLIFICSVICLSMFPGAIVEPSTLVIYVKDRPLPLFAPFLPLLSASVHR